MRSPPEPLTRAWRGHTRRPRFRQADSLDPLALAEPSTGHAQAIFSLPRVLGRGAVQRSSGRCRTTTAVVERGYGLRSCRHGRARAADASDASAPYGTRFGVDIKPVADRLRVVSDTGQNLRINLDTAQAISDGALNPGAPAVTAAERSAGAPGRPRRNAVAEHGHAHTATPFNATSDIVGDGTLDLRGLALQLR
jgi:hypothetical protein